MKRYFKKCCQVCKRSTAVDSSFSCRPTACGFVRVSAATIFYNTGEPTYMVKPASIYGKIQIELYYKNTKSGF